MKYKSSDKLKSGLPLGGIGAGKVEIFPNGLIGILTYQNNWGNPIYEWGNTAGEFGTSGTYGNHGNYFGVYVDDGDKKTAKLLTTEKIANYPGVKKIEFEGEFPFARLKYIDKDLPIDISLEAFSSFSPGSYKKSGLPGCFFVFKLKNNNKKSVNVSLLATARNTNTNWSVNRYNQFLKNKDLAGIIFKVKNPLSGDYSAGEFMLTAPKNRNTEVTFFEEKNLKARAFDNSFESVNLGSWDYFKQDGTLPGGEFGSPAEGQGREIGGAIASKTRLRPYEEKEIVFLCSWYYPVHYVGHRYEKWFSASGEVSQYLWKNFQKLKKDSQDLLNKLKDNERLPDWLSDGLLNNLYILISSSWWGKNGEFALYEAPIICPLMSTLDVWFYGSIPLSLLFPEFELNVMRQFKNAQRADGYIPHDLGKDRIDCPSDGTSAPPRWKDLNAKYILLIYRDYLWSKDPVYIKEFYPSIIRALEWLFTTDKNKDFLPDNEGKDQTFDAWDFYGVNSYTSSIFLVALKAAIEIAKLKGDRKIQNKCQEWFTKGRESFVEQLWNGKYFIASRSSNNSYEACTTAQLAGQWYAHMLNLGYILPQDMVKQSVKTMLQLNANSPYGAINSVLPEGKVDNISMQSSDIWPGITYGLASLAVYEGFVEDGLALTKKLWHNICYHNHNPWNQPDSISPETGLYIWGDYYLRNASVWAVGLALLENKMEVFKTGKTR